jgi:prepilin-type N-terminal cleavage/methylation domain-containing protein
MSPHPPHGPQRRPRHGFTLVELLVVIVVIAILVGFLTPAIMNARTAGQQAEVAVNINGLASDITTFKTEFRSDPPSSITLYEQPTGDPSWATDSATPQELARSRTIIRRLWPQFDFSASTTVPANSGWDLNGDGDKTDKLVLTGAECLVFFLGGVTATNYVSAADTAVTPAPPAGTPVADWIPLGFSKNPRNPFERGEGTRTGPFTEFEPTRLVNVFATMQGMPEYVDPLPGQINPYLYASSYDGRGYDPGDLAGSGMTNVYLQRDDNPAPANIGDDTEVAWNQRSFQIISPGLDTEYGEGGVYNPEQRFDIATYPNRKFERDNMTNFASGQLER